MIPSAPIWRHCERSEAISSDHPNLPMAGDCFVATPLAMTPADVAGIIADHHVRAPCFGCYMGPGSSPGGRRWGWDGGVPAQRHAGLDPASMRWSAAAGKFPQNRKPARIATVRDG